MELENDSAPTSLYLVRIWRRRSGDGAARFHGKLQHVVSGRSCEFEELCSLPQALEKMVQQEAGSFGPNPNLGSSASEDKPDAY